MFGLDDVLTGGLSLLGGVANNIFAGKRQDDAQQFNAQQALMNRDFQERMSSTAHQREAADLQAAGLNRILAVGKGSSSPSGSSAVSSPGAPVHDMLGPAVNTAMQHARMKEEINNMRETNTNIKQDTQKKQAETYATYNEGERKSAETANLRDTNAIIVENLSEAQLKAARSKVDREQLQTPAMKILRQTGNVGEEVQRASSAVGNIPALVNAGRGPRKPNDYVEETFSDMQGGFGKKTRTIKHSR